MQALNRYDGTLQMFVEDRHEPDPRHLRFLRWLGERGRLEHAIAGPSSGDQVAAPVDTASARSGPDLPPAA
jgi:hypothetical protein